MDQRTVLRPILVEMGLPTDVVDVFHAQCVKTVHDFILLTPEDMRELTGNIGFKNLCLQRQKQLIEELQTLDCPIALERIKEDRPITIKDDKGNTSKCIADIVSLFITIMDKLRLDIKAMDEIHPDLRDLSETLKRLSILPSDYDGRNKVDSWLQTLGGMQASDELTEDQVRQMVFDLESAYNEFNRVLHAV